MFRNNVSAIHDTKVWHADHLMYQKSLQLDMQSFLLIFVILNLLRLDLCLNMNLGQENLMRLFFRHSIYYPDPLSGFWIPLSVID